MVKGRGNARRRPGSQPTPWRPYAALALRGMVYNTIMSLLPDTEDVPSTGLASMAPPVEEDFPAGEGIPEMIEEMTSYSETNAIPVLIVRIPTMEALLAKSPPQPTTLKFAHRSCATFINGSDAFAGLTDKEIRAHWFKYDGHWCQLGSDRFAEFMLDSLHEWMDGPFRDRRDVSQRRVARWREVVERHPNDAYGYHYLHLALQEAGDIKGAIEALRMAIDADPSYAAAWDKLDELLRKQGSTQDLVAEWQGLVKDYPDAAQPLFHLGAALEASDDIDGAIDAYRNALEKDPENALYRDRLHVLLEKEGDLDGLLQLWRDAVALHPEDTGIRYSVIEILEDLGRLDEVVDAYRGLIAIEPDNASACHGIDSAFVQRNDIEGRLSQWRETVRAHPGHARPHLHLGSALEASGDLEGAIEEYNKALALDPENTEILSGLAGALAGKGELEAALDTFSQAIDADPEAWEPYCALDILFSERNDLDGRIARWRNAAQQYPGAVRPLLHLGQALDESGNTAEAIESFRKALALAPDDQGIRASLACALVRQGDIDAALDACHEPVPLQNGFGVPVADALEDAAGTLMAGSNAREAVRAYRAAIALAPENAAVRYPMLIEAFCKAGDREAACREIDVCREQGIELPPALVEKATGNVPPAATG